MIATPSTCGQVQFARQASVAAVGGDDARLELVLSTLNGGAFRSHAPTAFSYLFKALKWAEAIKRAYKLVNDLTDDIIEAMPFGRLILVATAVGAIERCGSQSEISKETAITVCKLAAVAKNSWVASSLEVAIKESPVTGDSTDQCKENAQVGIVISKTTSSDDEILKQCTEAAEGPEPKLSFGEDDRPGGGNDDDVLFGDRTLF